MTQQNQTGTAMSGCMPSNRAWRAAAMSPGVVAGLSGLAVYAQEAAPVSPGVQEADVGSMSEERPVQEWKPGDPVRVVPDLRTSPETDLAEGEPETPVAPAGSCVRKPVEPLVMEQNLRDLPEVDVHQEGDPVRIVPDMKESDSQD